MIYYQEILKINYQNYKNVNFHMQANFFKYEWKYNNRKYPNFDKIKSYLNCQAISLESIYDCIYLYCIFFSVHKKHNCLFDNIYNMELH